MEFWCEIVKGRNRRHVAGSVMVHHRDGAIHVGLVNFITFRRQKEIIAIYPHRMESAPLTEAAKQKAWCDIGVLPPPLDLSVKETSKSDVGASIYFCHNDVWGVVFGKHQSYPQLHSDRIKLVELAQEIHSQQLAAPS